jgi:ribonuclease III
VVIVGGRELGSGEGRSKKEAEQHAAEAAWNTLDAEAGGSAGGGGTGSRAGE